MSQKFQDFLQNHGIISQRSCPSTTQQNGFTERKNRHLLDVVRTLFIESSVPSRFWCGALSTTIFLINRLPSPSLSNGSPFFRIFGYTFDYSHLRTIGCVCLVHLQPYKRTKLTAQSVQCAFLGYFVQQKGFVCRFLLFKSADFLPSSFIFKFEDIFCIWELVKLGDTSQLGNGL